MNTYNLTCEPDLDLSLIDKNEENLIIVEQKDLKKLERYTGFSVEKIMSYNDEFPVFFTPGNGYDLFSFVFLDTNQKDTDFEKISLILMEKLLVIVISSQSLHQIAKYELDDELTFSSITMMYVTFMELAFSQMFSQLCDYEDHLHHIESQLIIGSKEYKIEDIIHERNMCLTTKKYARQLFLSGEDLKLNSNNLIPENEIQMLPNIGAKISLLNQMSGHLTEISAHLLEVYNSTGSAKTNNSINKLTVFNFFATPITVISGIYGMNFVNMPELHHPYGYFIVLGIILGISCIVFLFLKKSKLL